MRCFAEILSHNGMARVAPIIGAIMYIHNSSNISSGIAGPMLRAGFIEAPVKEPAMKARIATALPTARAILCVEALGIAAHKIVSISKQVIATSIMNACQIGREVVVEPKFSFPLIINKK
jgi:hypothetical protein